MPKSLNSAIPDSSCDTRHATRVMLGSDTTIPLFHNSTIPQFQDSERIGERRRDEVRERVVCGELVRLLRSRHLPEVDRPVGILHYDEVISQVEVQVFRDLESRAEADDVAVAGWQHRRAVVAGVAVVHVAGAHGHPVQEVVFAAEAEAPGVAPLEVFAVPVLGNTEADRLDAAPLGPGDRRAEAELLCGIPVAAEGDGLRERELRAGVQVLVLRDASERRVDTAAKIEVALDVVADARTVHDADREVGRDLHGSREVVAEVPVVALQVALEVVGVGELRKGHSHCVVVEVLAVVRLLEVLELDVAHAEARRDAPPVKRLPGEVGVEGVLLHRRLERVAGEVPVAAVLRPEPEFRVVAPAEGEVERKRHGGVERRRHEPAGVHLRLRVPVDVDVAERVYERRADYN